MDISRELSDEEVRQQIREHLLQEGHNRQIPPSDRLKMEREIFNSLRKLDVLSELLDEADVTEIMVNGPDQIFIEKKGQLFRSDKVFTTREKLSDVIQQIASAMNKSVNESNPIVDTRLSDGSRVNIILPPIAIDSGVISIRRFPKEPINMAKLLSLGSLNQEMADFLKVLVQAGYNIFLSGGTGSGKTTFLNALTEFIPSGERVITIEDSAELQVIGVDNLVRLEARDKTLEGKLEVSIRDLVRASLRMRPDRVIIGECRGGEALEMLQSMNTGHDGSLSSGHANSTRDMVARLETMVMMSGMELPVPAIRQQIASGIDLFIHLGRLSDRSRKVLEIAEVRGMRDGQVQIEPIYVYEKGEGGRSCWKKVGELENRVKLKMAGLALPETG
ncbi:MAG: CpaF family protein [Lachnospiraceae bacterium]|nr:CpaF family protein [Lachnospiraceae bacterium]